MIFRNKGIKEGHEVQSAQTSKLTDRNVNKESLKIKFDDLDICLINEQQVLNSVFSRTLKVIVFKSIPNPTCEAIRINEALHF